MFMIRTTDKWGAAVTLCFYTVYFNILPCTYYIRWYIWDTGIKLISLVPTRGRIWCMLQDTGALVWWFGYSFYWQLFLFTSSVLLIANWLRFLVHLGCCYSLVTRKDIWHLWPVFISLHLSSLAYCAFGTK